MKNNKLALYAVRNTLGLMAYVAAVVWFLNESSRWTPAAPSQILVMMGLLLLFVLSALVCGLLLLGQPIWLFLHGEKTDALKLLALTVAGLTLGTFGILLTTAIF